MMPRLIKYVGLVGWIWLVPFHHSSAADRLEVDPQVLRAQAQRVQIMEKAAAATIAIFGLDGGGGGSGVIVTPDGYALTNYHVSSACGDHMRCGLNDGRMYDAVIVGIDATGDVSLIKLLGRNDFPTAPLGDSDTVRVGHWCFAAGNPFVLASNLQPSISFGLVSGVNRYQYPAGTLLEYADCIQTDAAINPGNSGGPLFNMAGEIIGINGRCSFEKRNRVNVGVGYAISANQVKQFMGVLRSGRLVDHATLGATVATDASGKIVISNILSSSDAYRRGLRYGDEIVRLADREVQTTNTFKNILGTLPKEWRIPVEFRRAGQLRTILVRLDGVHSEKELIDLVSGELMPGAHPEESEKPTEETQTDEAEADSVLPEELQNLRPDLQLTKSLLESRTGFANYNFNRTARARVWQRLESLGNYRQSGKTWTITGSLAGETTEFGVSLDADSGTLELGSRTLQVLFDDERSDTVARRRETGLLLALRALQELLQIGPGRLGDTIYLGTFPTYTSQSTTLANQPLNDVLRTLWYDTEVRFSVAPEGAQVELIEVFGDPVDDPVELICERYAEFDLGKEKVRFPSRLRLQYGTETALVLEVKNVDLASAAPRPEGSQNRGEIRD